jgi:hypothetical protein
VGPKAGLDTVAKRKNLFIVTARKGTLSSRPARNPVIILTELALSAPKGQYAPELN